MAKKNSTYKYNYYDASGKRHCKTFTAPTMREARLKAAQWELDHRDVEGPSMTVLDALKAYISGKEAVLSPATIRGYEGIKNKISTEPLCAIRLKDLTPADIQLWIANAVTDGKTAKTIMNWYGLLQSALKAQLKGFDFDQIRLPQRVKYIGTTPSDDDVKALISYARGLESKELLISIMLAAFGPLRRSETCALTDADIKGRFITVSKAKVKDQHGQWVIKTTKTTESKRVLEFPDWVMKELKGIKGELIKCTPNALMHQYHKAAKAVGVPEIRFHDLRHYSASIMHAMNVPDVYIKQRGGWSSDYVMKRVYIDAMEAERKKQTTKIMAHFEELAEASEAKSEAKIAINTL